jgi:hypothetical protein
VSVTNTLSLSVCFYVLLSFSFNSIIVSVFSYIISVVEGNFTFWNKQLTSCRSPYMLWRAGRNFQVPVPIWRKVASIERFGPDTLPVLYNQVPTTLSIYTSVTIEEGLGHLSRLLSGKVTLLIYYMSRVSKLLVFSGIYSGNRNSRTFSIV